MINRKLTAIVFAVCACLCLLSQKDATAAKKNYTVSPDAKVLGRYAKSQDLNKQTKHYFMLRYYMDKLEKWGRNADAEKGNLLHNEHFICAVQCDDPLERRSPDREDDKCREGEVSTGGRHFSGGAVPAEPEKTKGKEVQRFPRC